MNCPICSHPVARWCQHWLDDNTLVDYWIHSTSRHPNTTILIDYGIGGIDMALRRLELKGFVSLDHIQKLLLLR